MSEREKMGLEIQSELKQLRKRVHELESIQARCTHDWTEPVMDYVDEEIQEFRMQGSDGYYVGTGRYKTVPCWKRTCMKCGKVQFTKETEKVVVQSIRRPKF